jgi:hypothetical protein
MGNSSPQNLNIRDRISISKDEKQIKDIRIADTLYRNSDCRVTKASSPIEDSLPVTLLMRWATPVHKI